jgi:predicted carbohydrate-binding protein with CBM5 and CBM33 domain
MPLITKALDVVARGILLIGATYSAFGHGLIQNPPSRNWFCGAITKPDHVLNGAAQYPACGGAFASDFSGGYSFMSVLTHTEGRAVVKPLPQNVCGFNSETWQGRSTPWDQPIDWPTSKITPGPRDFSWNISWGSHFSDTKEFQYWITKPGFQYQVGRPLAWSDFEDAAFCSLEYNDSNPTGNPNVVADKAGTMFHTKCTVPQRQGRHVIYGEWGRNQWTYERFHSCVDVVFGEESAGFSLSTTPGRLSVSRGATVTSTVTITRTGGFSGPVALTASGLPAGVTAAFSPVAANGTSATLTLTASVLAAAGSSTVSVTGASGSVAHTAPIILDVTAQDDFSLSASPISSSIAPGASATANVTITRASGFSAPVALSATGLPQGVTAIFSPVSATGSGATLTLNASSTAAAGSAKVIVSGTSGALTRTASIDLTVNGSIDGTFSLTAPARINLSKGASGTATITIARTGGFSQPVAFTATELPAGITAAFDPASASGTSTTLRLDASAAAITGSGTILVTGAGAGVTRTISVPFTVNPGSTTGSVTVTPVVNVNQPWYNEVAVRLNHTAPLTALSVTITVQRTTGVGFAGQYNTVGGQIQQSNSSTPSSVTYQYNLTPGQTLGTGTHRIFAAQAGGNGTAHPTSGDTYEVTYTVGGVTSTQTGSF